MKLSEAAHEKFKDHLFAGHIRPGQFVSQREVAKLIGIPLGPVREALQKLEVEGLVRSIPQRGVQVTEVSLRLIRNTFQLRLFIEKEAARRFAEDASDATIRDLEDAHKRIVDSAKTDIDDRILNEAQEVDWGLHNTMVKALGNEIIWQVHSVNNDRVRLIRLDRGDLTLLTPDTIFFAMEEHLAVIDACKHRDAPRAAAAMEKHLTVALRRALA